MLLGSKSRKLEDLLLVAVCVVALGSIDAVQAASSG